MNNMTFKHPADPVNIWGFKKVLLAENRAEEPLYVFFSSLGYMQICRCVSNPAVDTDSLAENYHFIVH